MIVLKVDINLMKVDICFSDMLRDANQITCSTSLKKLLQLCSMPRGLQYCLFSENAHIYFKSLNTPTLEHKLLQQ